MSSRTGIPDVFSEPDELRLDRDIAENPATPHLRAGKHACLGARLARWSNGSPSRRLLTRLPGSTATRAPSRAASHLHPTASEPVSSGRRRARAVHH